MLVLNNKLKLSILGAVTSEGYLRYSSIVFSLKKQICKQMKKLFFNKEETANDFPDLAVTETKNLSYSKGNIQDFLQYLNYM